jgi:hypothetical protein
MKSFNNKTAITYFKIETQLLGHNAKEQRFILDKANDTFRGLN